MSAAKVGGRGRTEQRELLDKQNNACSSNGEVFQACMLLLEVKRAANWHRSDLSLEQLLPLLAWFLRCKTVIFRDFFAASQNHCTAKKANTGSQC